MASISFSSSRSSNSSNALTTWTAKQNRLFENALAIYDKDTPDRWDSIAKVVGDKTVQEVKQHYQLLVQDIQLIEAGLVPSPNYRDDGKGIEVVKDPEHRIRNLNIYAEVSEVKR